jgi:YcxB-like protein
MPIYGELRITYAVLRRMTLSAISGRMRAGRTVGVVLLVLLLMVALISGSFTAMLKPMLLSVLIIALPELMALLGWWGQRKSLDQPLQYRPTTSGVEVHSATTHMQVDWAGISQVRRRRDVWLLKRTGPRQIALPRSAFAPEDQRIIVHFLAERFPTGRARTVA